MRFKYNICLLLITIISSGKKEAYDNRFAAKPKWRPTLEPIEEGACVLIESQQISMNSVDWTINRVFQLNHRNYKRYLLLEPALGNTNKACYIVYDEIIESKELIKHITISDKDYIIFAIVDETYAVIQDPRDPTQSYLCDIETTDENKIIKKLPFILIDCFFGNILIIQSQSNAFYLIRIKYQKDTRLEIFPILYEFLITEDMPMLYIFLLKQAIRQKNLNVYRKIMLSIQNKDAKEMVIIEDGCAELIIKMLDNSPILCKICKILDAVHKAPDSENGIQYSKLYDLVMQENLIKNQFVLDTFELSRIGYTRRLLIFYCLYQKLIYNHSISSEELHEMFEKIEDREILDKISYIKKMLFSFFSNSLSEIDENINTKFIASSKDGALSVFQLSNDNFVYMHSGMKIEEPIYWYKESDIILLRLKCPNADIIAALIYKEQWALETDKDTIKKIIENILQQTYDSHVVKTDKMLNLEEYKTNEMRPFLYQGVLYRYVKGACCERLLYEEDPALKNIEIDLERTYVEYDFMQKKFRKSLFHLRLMGGCFRMEDQPEDVSAIVEIIEIKKYELELSTMRNFLIIYKIATKSEKSEIIYHCYKPINARKKEVIPIEMIAAQMNHAILSNSKEIAKFIKINIRLIDLEQKKAHVSYTINEEVVEKEIVFVEWRIKEILVYAYNITRKHYIDGAMERFCKSCNRLHKMILAINMIVYPLITALMHYHKMFVIGPAFVIIWFIIAVGNYCTIIFFYNNSAKNDNNIIKMVNEALPEGYKYYPILKYSASLQFILRTTILGFIVFCFLCIIMHII